MENAITDFLDKIIPELGALLSDVKLWLNLAMFAGPLLLLLVGAFYFFLAPKEANHKAGYRTFFGMGSVKAWNFTQKIAGMIWGGVGALLLVVALIGCIILGGQEASQAVSTGMTILIIEAVCCLLAFLAIEIWVFLSFDANGNPKVRINLKK